MTDCHITSVATRHFAYCKHLVNSDNINRRVTLFISHLGEPSNIKTVNVQVILFDQSLVHRSDVCSVCWVGLSVAQLVD